MICTVESELVDARAAMSDSRSVRESFGPARRLISGPADGRFWIRGNADEGSGSSARPLNPD